MLDRIRNGFGRAIAEPESNLPERDPTQVDVLEGGLQEEDPSEIQKRTKEKITTNLGPFQFGSVPKEAIKKASPAELGKQDGEGNTPLHTVLEELGQPSSWWGRNALLETAKLLIQKMSAEDLCKANLKGMTPLLGTLESGGDPSLGEQITKKLSPEQLGYMLTKCKTEERKTSVKNLIQNRLKNEPELAQDKKWKKLAGTQKVSGSTD